VRSLDLVFIRCLASFIAASVSSLASATAQEQGVDEGGNDLLVLSIVCSNEYYDTSSIGQCLNRQQVKVDRWLQGVVGSYAGWAAEEMELRRRHGGNPRDLVAQLRKSQAAFETHREESAELVLQSIDGMIASLEASRTYFDLTVDRARFLIANCYGQFTIKPTDRVDLTTPEWCSISPQ
jgi:uncharacterized protein YecT (DUF1311 family)